MRISRREISRIIQEEKRKILNEDCGCGCKGSPGGCGGDDMGVEKLDSYIDDGYGMEVIHGDDLILGDDNVEYEEEITTDNEFLTKEEALKSVVAIAMSTSCPVTRDALLDSVQNLMV
jgi:hypothetical protein